MLPICKISHVAVFEKEWRKAKLGKISASRFGELVGEKSHKGIFTQGAMTYLEGLVHEIITGKPARDEFFTKDTDWGNAHESEGVEFLAKKIGLNIMRNSERGGTNRLIINDEFSGCTPDALLTKYSEDKIFDQTGEFIKVSTLEVKCPQTGFIKLFKCNTPADLKSINKIYYWQVITQMDFSNSLNSFFGVYHPDYPVKGKFIEFKKVDLIDDIKIFRATLEHAKNEIKNTLSILGYKK